MIKILSNFVVVDIKYFLKSSYECHCCSSSISIIIIMNDVVVIVVCIIVL